MSDLIDRSAVLNSIEDWMDDGTGDEFDRGYDFAMRRAMRIIRNAPAVDAVPVVHAGWIAEYRTICSACKTQFDDDIFWIRGGFIKPNYCPNCGARMDGEDDATD